jgi:hypothetical protein
MRKKFSLILFKWVQKSQNLRLKRSVICWSKYFFWIKLHWMVKRKKWK